MCFIETRIVKCLYFSICSTAIVIAHVNGPLESHLLEINTATTIQPTIAKQVYQVILVEKEAYQSKNAIVSWQLLKII